MIHSGRTTNSFETDYPGLSKIIWKAKTDAEELYQAMASGSGARDDVGMRDVTIAYGMTETLPVSAQTSRSDTIEQRGTTVGRVHPHVEIKMNPYGQQGAKTMG